MKLYYFFFITVYLLGTGQQIAYGQTEPTKMDFHTITVRIRQDAMSKAGSATTIATNAACYAGLLLTDRSWSDINYHDTSQYWDTYKHLTRLQTMALAYIQQNGTDEVLRTKILRWSGLSAHRLA